MSTQRDSSQVFEEDFLPLRARLIEIAASLDRIDRAGGSLDAEKKWSQIQEAIRALLAPTEDRAEQLQLIFSRQYDSDWRKNLGVNER